MRPKLEVLDTALVERIIDDAKTVRVSPGILVDHRPACERLATARARA